MQDEGYIKFHCLHHSGVLPAPVPQELIDLRNRLHAAGFIGVLPDGVGFGNVSMRGKNGFWVTASQTGHLVNATDNAYSWVSSADPDQNLVVCSGLMPASSESMTHAVCYLALPQIHVVVHIHNNELWNTNAGVWIETNAQVAYGTQEMAWEVFHKVRNLGASGFLRMAGHEDGLLYWGDSVQQVIKHLPGL